MSYRKKHIKSNINKIRNPKGVLKSIFKKLWFWIIVLVLIIIFFAFYFFIFYPGVQVKNIVIYGNQKVATKEIANLISDNINDKILKVGGWEVDSKSIFLTNSDKLNKEILNKFPIIENVKIDRKFMQSLVFEINERIPVAIFCSSTEKTTASAGTNGDCYFMDKNGIIFEPLYVMPQNIVIVRQTKNDEQIFVGEKVVQQNIIDSILKIEKNLKDNFQISLKEALVSSPLRLDVNTSENWQIYFSLDPSSDINLQLTKLNLLLNGGVSAGPEGYPRKNLRYIDLRPKDKAIICDNKTCGG